MPPARYWYRKPNGAARRRAAAPPGALAIPSCSVFGQAAGSDGNVDADAPPAHASATTTAARLCTRPPLPALAPVVARQARDQRPPLQPPAAGAADDGHAKQRVAE